MIIDILSHPYEIIIHKQAESGNLNFGSHSGAGAKIFINSNPAFSAKESTLLHEIIEALNYHLGLNMKHETILRLEVGLYQVLKANKLISLEKFLKEEEYEEKERLDGD